MYTWLIASILYVSAQASEKYCAWNRAVQPIQNPNTGTYDNALTYNFINGEFERDYSFSSGDLWHGVPYYKMSLTTCYVVTLWLYRYMDIDVYPPSVTWVIATNVGMKPEYGYAYCTANDQSTPVGGCDGKWKIGNPRDDQIGQTAAQILDDHFHVRLGGCPQVTCAKIELGIGNGNDWEGTYEYLRPNIYIQRNSDTSESGEWYAFFNPKTWAWAANEFIENYDVCEQYKYGRGFTNVANVITGPASNSLMPGTNGDIFRWSTLISSTPDIVKCIGTVPTPAPVTQETWVPTKAPQDKASHYCYQTGWCKVSELKIAEIVSLCGCLKTLEDCGMCTNDPVILPKLSESPSPSPSPSPTKPPLTNGQTYPPTDAPVGGGSSDDDDDDDDKSPDDDDDDDDDDDAAYQVKSTMWMTFIMVFVAYWQC